MLRTYDPSQGPMGVAGDTDAAADLMGVLPLLWLLWAIR
jgi:hypothetical protein